MRFFRPGDCPSTGDEQTGYPSTKQCLFIAGRSKRGIFYEPCRQDFTVPDPWPDPASGYAAVTHPDIGLWHPCRKTRTPLRGQTVQGGPGETIAGTGAFFWNQPRGSLRTFRFFGKAKSHGTLIIGHRRENAGNINNKNPSRQIERYARTMFFFFHLVTGIILGFLIADLLHDRRWIVPCVIGAVLPDIVDKPLNFILLPAVNGNGRFLFHNLIVFAILLVAGLLLWKYYRSPLILALDTGILSHQILDSMWTEPVRWLYPLLGPYPAQAASPPDYLFDLLLTDLYNPVEWVLIILCICILVLYWQRGSLAAAATRHKKSFGTLLKCAGIMLWVFCGIVLAYGLLKTPITGLTSGADQDVFTIVVTALAAILVLGWEAALQHATPVPKNPRVTSDRPAPSPAPTGIEHMEYLVRLIGKDPDWISFSSAREIAGAFFLAGDRDKRADEYLTLGLLGTIVVVAAAGGIVLLLSGKEIPTGMLALGAIAAGLLAGSLVMAGSTGPAP